MKRIVYLLVIALVAATVCGCAVKSVSYAEYGESGKYRVSQAMYKYWLAYYKTRFYVIMEDYGIISEATYTEDFWDETIEDGETYGDRVFSHVESLVNEMLVCAALFDEYGLDKDTKMKKTLDDTVASFVDNDIQAAGSRAELNKQLGQIGLNVTELKKIYELEAKELIMAEYLFGEDGKEPVTDAEREEYYQKNYHRIKYVLLDPYKKQMTDVYGYPVVDTTTGYYKTVELTEEEQAEVRKLAASIRDQAAAGADFDALVSEYNQDKAMGTYTDGFFFTEHDAYDADFLSDAVPLKVGETVLSESSYGLIIVKKYPLDPELWKNEINAAFFSGLDDSIIGEKKEKKYGAYYGDIKRDAEFPKELCLADLPFLTTALSAEN